MVAEQTAADFHFRGAQDFSAQLVAIFEDLSDLALFSVANRQNFVASGINLTALKGVNVTHAVVTKVAADSPYTVLASDETILVNAVAGAVTVTLPTATSGRILTVKKLDVSANAVTLAGTVDGAASPTLTVQWSSRILQADGAAWFVLAGWL